MDELMVHTLRDESERDESASSETAPELSISFGRFENDSLSWERWSSFSQNKYLEEVEKCSTPGSVAEKKAYFEAHYKKIAARQAQLLEQEMQMGANPLGSGEPSCEDLVSNGCEIKTMFTPSKVERIVEAKELDTNSISLVFRSDVIEAIKDAAVMNSNKDVAIEIECKGSSNDDRENLKSRFNSVKSNIPEVGVLVKENNSMAKMELPQHLDNETRNIQENWVELPQHLDYETNNTQENKVEFPQHLNYQTSHTQENKVRLPQHLDNETTNTQEIKVEVAKLKPPKESQKRTPATKEKNLMRTKKNPASPTPRSPQISTPRASKPKPASTVISASQTSATKGSSSSVPRSRNSSTVESKRSMHLSHSLGSGNSESTSFTTTRKSFIMEKMGDKEIVKRAFKAFQNNFNQLGPSTETKPSAPQQVFMKKTERNFSTPMTRQKDTKGTRKTVENVRGAPSTQEGARHNSVSARPLKVAGSDHPSPKSSPSSSLGLRSGGRAERRKQFIKKLEAKSNAKEVDRMDLRSKSKEGAKEEIINGPDSHR